MSDEKVSVYGRGLRQRINCKIMKQSQLFHSGSRCSCRVYKSRLSYLNLNP